jgi:hypothetical protein
MLIAFLFLFLISELYASLIYIKTKRKIEMGGKETNDREREGGA